MIHFISCLVELSLCDICLNRILPFWKGSYKTWFRLQLQRKLFARFKKENGSCQSWVLHNQQHKSLVRGTTAVTEQSEIQMFCSQSQSLAFLLPLGLAQFFKKGKRSVSIQKYVFHPCPALALRLDWLQMTRYPSEQLETKWNVNSLISTSKQTLCQTSAGVWPINHSHNCFLLSWSGAELVVFLPAVTLTCRSWEAQLDCSYLSTPKFSISQRKWQHMFNNNKEKKNLISISKEL